MGRTFAAARELGARAYAAQDWITAELHFSEAISVANVQSASSSNRSTTSLDLAKCHSESCCCKDAAT